MSRSLSAGIPRMMEEQLSVTTKGRVSFHVQMVTGNIAVPRTSLEVPLNALSRIYAS